MTPQVRVRGSGFVRNAVLRALFRTQQDIHQTRAMVVAVPRWGAGVLLTYYKDQSESGSSPMCALGVASVGYTDAGHGGGRAQVGCWRVAHLLQGSK